jgi:hypothetical protein
MSATNKETKVETSASKETLPVKRGGYRGNRYKPATITVMREQNFSGKCDSLSGFVYDCSDGKHSDRFNIATKEIAEYIGREYPYGGNIRWIIQNLELFKEEEPSEMAASSSVLKKRMWEKRVDKFIKRENKLKENCQMAYSLVIGQCTANMRAKLEAVVGYRDMESRSDLIGLIKTIKGLSFQFEGQQSKTRGLVLAHKRFQYLNQTKDMTDACFLKKLLPCVAVLEQYRGTIGRDQGAVEDEIEAAGYTILATAEETKQASDIARSKFLAMSYLLVVDKQRYGKLLDELENDFTKGTDNYPDSMTKAYNLVVNHKGQQSVVSRLFNDSEAVSFANVDGKKIPPDIATIKCYACQKMGHYENECPSITEPSKIEGATMLIMEETVKTEADLNGAVDYDSSGEFSFHQGGSKYVYPNWILLGSQSTADIFCNSALLSNIRDAGKSIKVHCNAGTIIVTQVGTLKNYGEVWFNKKAIANILSLAKVKERYPVHYDSDNGNQFIVAQPTKQVVFQQSATALYYHDTTNIAVVMVNTVSGNPVHQPSRQSGQASPVSARNGRIPIGERLQKHGELQHDTKLPSDTRRHQRS